MRGKGRKTFGALSKALALILCALLLFLPLPVKSGEAGGDYECLWEDGSVTRESYAAAYAALCGVTSDGDILISRGGKTGRIGGTEEFYAVCRCLEEGGLAELLSLDPAVLTPLERTAIGRSQSAVLWLCDGEWFGWTDHGVARTSARSAEKIILLSGGISASALASSGASALALRSEAEFSAASLAGTAVSSIEAEEPYSVFGGAVYLDTAGGKRFVAALPPAEELVLCGYDYADEGALLPCTRLCALTVAFSGSAPSAAGSYYYGELAYLFCDGEDYFVPETLKRVRVTGGTLVSHAFYRCSGVEEIDACGVAAELIEEDAFIDCANLNCLHSPRADVRLPAGSFSAHTAECGCTVFIRND